MEHLGIAKDREVSVHVAPMIDVSNRHFRSFMRLLSKRTVLWTEMLKDDAILYSTESESRLDWLLGKNEEEHPVVCQLGGADPQRLADAAEVVERFGYNEVNLNVGCPSSRVCCKGEFGASLMKRPELVRDCVHAMQRRVSIPVTVKTRLGVDEFDSPEFTKKFVDTVAQSGCETFYMHARKAWLKGLSPAENRTIPPLDYGRVMDLCEHRPDLNFVLNGGVSTLDAATSLLRDSPSNMTGIMLGRAAINTPAIFSRVDEILYGDAPMQENRRGLLSRYSSYLRETVRPAKPEDPFISSGVAIACLKPVSNLFTGFPGSKFVARMVEDRARTEEWRSRGCSALLEGITDAVEERYPAVMAQNFTESVHHNNMLKNPALRSEAVVRSEGRDS